MPKYKVIVNASSKQKIEMYVNELKSFFNIYEIDNPLCSCHITIKKDNELRIAVKYPNDYLCQYKLEPMYNDWKNANTIRLISNDVSITWYKNINNEYRKEAM